LKDFKHLKINKDNGIVHVLMDRGDGRNALSYDLMKELTECANKLKPDIDVNCIILSGQGDSFSVGADLKDKTFP
jgi:Enoyl-CoA hydratase/carnithine racemase